MIAALVVLQAIAPVAAVAASTPGQNGPPSGMVGVPNAAISDKIPDHAQGKIPDASAFHGSVMTDAHADTLAVEVTTRAAAQGRASACSRNGGANNPPFCDGPTLALNVSDDVNHEGRRVAVPKDVLADALGYEPTTATVVHESGEESEVSVRERGSLYVFSVEGFSTNTVTFASSVELGGGPATDGTTFTYDLSDMDAASAPNLTFIGREATEWDNASGIGLGNGDTLNVNPSGDEIRGPANGDPEVVFEGEEVSTAQTESGTHSAGSAAGISIGGNLDPEGPVNGEPELSVTGSQELTSMPYSTSSTDTVWSNSSNPPSYVDEVYVEYENDGTSLDDYGNVEIYVDGQLEASHREYVHGNHQKSVNLSVGASASQTVKIKFWMEGSANKTLRIYGASEARSGIPSSVTVDADDGTSVSLGDFTDGETKTTGMDLSNSASSLSFSSSVGGSFDWSLNFNEVTATENPGADLDGDGTDDVTHSGILRAGETATYAASSLGVGDDTATVSTAAGSTVGVEVRLQEVVGTRDPAADLNGESVNYVGALSPGETANYTLSESSLQNGTNQLNISVGDGSLSADAPAPVVGVEYEHDARDAQSVTYLGETWSERYNVSRTWGDANQNATLKVPFAGNVVSNRDLTVYINGTETGPTYSVFDNTTLEVGLGDLDPQTKMRVVANGSKVVVRNGSIQVLGPTAEGNDLDTRFEVTSADDGFRIDVSGTASGDRVHYLANSSWTPASDYVRVENSGAAQYLHVPNASAGSTATARTLPLSVAPQNDVELAVADATEPKFKLRPGRVSGDAVDLTYYDTNSGTEYQLLDEGNDKIAASDTAESPVHFSVDSDEETLYSIAVADSSGSTGGGGGSGGRDRSRVTDLGTEPLASPIVMIVVAAAVILVGAWVASRTGLSARWVAGVGVLVALGTLETLRPGTVTKPVEDFLGGASDVAPVLWLAAGVAALLTVYGLYSRYGKPPRVVLNRGGR